MRKKIVIALTASVAASTIGFGTAGTASAAPEGAGKPIGVSCMQYGLAALRSLGSPAEVPQAALGLPLNQVLALHRNQPAVAAGVLINVVKTPPADVIAACGKPA